MSRDYAATRKRLTTNFACPIASLLFNLLTCPFLIMFSASTPCSVRPFHTAERTLEGIESLHMMRKGRLKRISGEDVAGQVKFVESLFGVAA